METERLPAPPVRPALQHLQPYVPGKSQEAVAREYGLADVIKMNQNENPLGPSPRAWEAATAAFARMNFYPEGTALDLRETLSVFWDLPVDWFVAGNGSDEIFRLLAEVYLTPHDSVVVPTPSFGGYPLVSGLMGASVIPVSLGDDGIMDPVAMAAIARECRARLIFLCRPNNPTGTVFPAGELHAALDSLPADTLVVLDEAYWEFDETEFDSRALLLSHPNLVITRTFSKVYGLAGLRIGYGIMRPEIAASLRRVRDPFSVNLAGMAAGAAALADREHLERSRQLVHTGKRVLSELFDRLGVAYTPSQANFILFHLPSRATAVYEALLRRGVLVRPCTAFGLPHSLRVTIGTPQQNDAFACALERALTEPATAQLPLRDPLPQGLHAE